MATANRSISRSRGRRWLIAAGVLAALVAGLVAAFGSTVRAYAVTGAAFGARVGCSCRFAGGRPLSDCAKDFEPGMAMIRLSEDVPARSVTARFPLVARQTATYREGWGCQLEPWQD